MLNLAAVLLVRKSFIKVQMQYLLLAILLSIAPTFVAANTQDRNTIALVGKWTSTAKRPNGATMVNHVVLSQNMRFSGTLTSTDKPDWTYSGSWSISGKYLVWRYEVSSRPLPEAAKVDADEIISIDDSKLVLLSTLTGKKHEYIRERYAE